MDSAIAARLRERVYVLQMALVERGWLSRAQGRFLLYCLL